MEPSATFLTAFKPLKHRSQKSAFALTTGHGGYGLDRVLRFLRRFVREDAMEDVNRRSAMALGLTFFAAPLAACATKAETRTSASNEGQEIAPGVRLVELGTRESDIPAYKSISVVDLVFEPGAIVPETVMDNDMVCHITAGEFLIRKGPRQFTVKEGDIYTCAKGQPDGATNTSNVVGIHHIAMLIPA
jgi:quercetin dioxygenase-like cupin family protein